MVCIRLWLLECPLPRLGPMRALQWFYSLACPANYIVKCITYYRRSAERTSAHAHARFPTGTRTAITPSFLPTYCTLLLWDIISRVQVNNSRAHTHILAMMIPFTGSCSPRHTRTFWPPSASTHTPELGCGGCVRVARSLIGSMQVCWCVCACLRQLCVIRLLLLCKLDYTRNGLRPRHIRARAHLIRHFILVKVA